METETTSVASGEATPNLEQISNDVIAKHRKQRSDKGQPRGSRKGKVETVQSSSETSGEASLATVDVEAVRKGVSSLFKAIDALLVRKTYRVAKEVTEDENFSRTIAADVKMPDEENSLISDLSASVCQRHEVLAKFAPEALLVVALGSYGTRVMVAFKKLDDIAATKAQIKK